MFKRFTPLFVLFFFTGLSFSQISESIQSEQIPSIQDSTTTTISDDPSNVVPSVQNETDGEIVGDGPDTTNSHRSEDSSKTVIIGTDDISETVDSKIDIQESPGSSGSNTSPVIISTDRPYNPFDFENRIMLNLCIHHLYYNERILKGDIVNSFTQQQGYPPDTIIGKPKSTESGMLLGFWFKYMKRFSESGIFIRPQFELTLGIGNTYDGSSQGQPTSNGIDQKTGIRFIPFDTVKNNFFFTTEFNLGYSNTNTRLPFALYSGLRFAFWNRDMLSNEYISNYEDYLWWSVPVGFMINKPVSPRWSLGCDFAFDFMFSGTMQAVMRAEYSGEEIDFPEVTLGNRCGYRLELWADGMLAEHLSFCVAPYLNLYGFGKSNTGYAQINGSRNTTTQIPFYEPESATFIAGMNITFTILMSRN
jgi:hypothetical protein